MQRSLGHPWAAVVTSVTLIFSRSVCTYTHIQTHKYACWYVWLYEERERIRVRPPAVRYTQKTTQTNMHTCVSVYVCVKKHFCGGEKNTHTSNNKNTGKYMPSNDAKSTLSLKHSISVLSHEKLAHSLKRWKSGKNIRWQDRQLVVHQIKPPVPRRNRESGNSCKVHSEKQTKK